MKCRYCGYNIKKTNKGWEDNSGVKTYVCFDFTNTGSKHVPDKESTVQRLLNKIDAL